MRVIYLLLFIFVSCSRQTKPKEQVFPVQVEEAQTRDVPILINSIGHVYSLQTVLIRPQVGGVVQEAYVKQGEYVKKGDKLYRIDPRPYEAALDKAKAALIKDKATLEFNEMRQKRYKELTQKEYYSKVNYEQIESETETSRGQLLSDQADIETAQLALEWTTPVSPLDGKISQYNIDPGNLVQANNPDFLVDIRQIDPADIRFSINQSDFVEVQKAIKSGSLKFFAILPQLDKEPREGTIYFIDNHIDLDTGTILLKGTLPNKDERFWPGEFVRIRLQLKIEKNAVVIPEEAIRLGQEGAFLYVYKPETQRVEYRKVIKGQVTDHWVLIEKGIKAGEKVVTKGQINLRPDSKVLLRDEKK